MAETDIAFNYINKIIKDSLLGNEFYIKGKAQEEVISILSGMSGKGIQASDREICDTVHEIFCIQNFIILYFNVSCL